MRFLVVGCGSIGKRHLGNLLRLRAGEVAAWDVRPERREEVRGRLGAEVHDSFDGGLDAGPDAVLVCTPTGLHLPYALAAAERGLHLFVEKPLSDSLEGTDRLLAEATAHGSVLLVGCNFRFHRGLALVKRMVDEGGIGRPLFARAQFGQYLPDWHPWEDYRHGYNARRALGGGALLDTFHELDYLTWILGEAREVCAFVGKLSGLEIDTEDVAEVLLRFEGGALGEVHADYVQRSYNRSCEIVGEVGTILWSYQENRVALYAASEGRWQVTRWPGIYDANEMYLSEMEHFLACLRGEQRPTLDGAGATRLLEVVVAARESAKLGRKVTLR